ncbi:capsid protein [Clostridium sp. 'White wine YQ']|uniref:capsid protein n=1 Tax=Clostridium sp. 'White wine YQ' TaxID=3027474 RepID=UPI002366AC9B|nr:capsid protein [Clostridium sp. 'White wine YQ']MDD7793689.1 capsid protein [Clostridium sp. 'White wine YQ']
MPVLNYATQYQEVLDQNFPYVLNFGALYNSPSNSLFKWTNSKTIEIPVISTTGRKDANRDTIGSPSRNFDNTWETKTLTNQRYWDTLVHPMDIDQTNMAASIPNITQVYNEQQKFPEMDAYLISKVYSEWISKGKTADTTVIDETNILTVFDNLMQKMDEARVPVRGRILYVTPTYKTMLKHATQVNRQVMVDGMAGNSGAINRTINRLEEVEIVSVPSDLMKTIYNFTSGWVAGVGAKQINMVLIHPLAVITPHTYTFAALDEPTAKTQGKYYYYEESFEDVFVLDSKVNAIEFVISA